MQLAIIPKLLSTTAFDIKESILRLVCIRNKPQGGALPLKICRNFKRET